MQISLEKAVEGFIAYLADQIVLIPNLGEKFVAYAALGALRKNPNIMLSKVRPWMEMSGMLVDGKVDLETAKAALDMAFGQVPKLSYFGFTFTHDDATALLQKMYGQEVA